MPGPDFLLGMPVPPLHVQRARSTSASLTSQLQFNGDVEAQGIEYSVTISRKLYSCDGSTELLWLEKNCMLAEPCKSCRQIQVHFVLQVSCNSADV